MLEETIIAQWLQYRSDIALKKLLDNEPLTFEDDIVTAIIGQREETKRLENKIMARFERIDAKFERVDGEMTDIKLLIRDMQADMKEIRRGLDDARKETINQTRWFIGSLGAMVALMKILDIVFGK
jgi:hypothetical protein